MIDLYYWPTPNGHKITLFLEEARAPFRIVPINILRGEQGAADFRRVSPNGRIPAIVDHDPADGGEPQTVFESGAILLYLAEKIGRFLPASPRRKWESLEWLFWQVGGLGPMAGQTQHFKHYAPEKIEYAIGRYQRETTRLYEVLDSRLAGREFIAGELSVADFACFPWIEPHKRHGQDLSAHPDLERWFRSMEMRPATQRAYAHAVTYDPVPKVELDDRAKQALFGVSPGKEPA